MAKIKSSSELNGKNGLFFFSLIENRYYWFSSELLIKLLSKNAIALLSKLLPADRALILLVCFALGPFTEKSNR
jgi:hypothetical protein